jgi:hemoglobin-like flavoprotein
VQRAATARAREATTSVPTLAGGRVVHDKGLVERRQRGYHRSMDPRSRDAFLASFNRCRASAGFLDAFYRSFVASSEEVRAKFAGTDMKQQVRMLEDSLYVVAVAVQGEEGSLARSELPRIAARHSRKDRDIRPELYDLWLECLIETVRTHDPQCSAEVEAAWRETMAFGIDYMRARY